MDAGLWTASVWCLLSYFNIFIFSAQMMFSSVLYAHKTRLSGGGACSYLVWAGRLVDPAGVLVVLLCLGLVGHAVGLVHGRDVVHQGDGLHGLVHPAADGLPHFGGSGSPGGRKVMGGLETRMNSEDGELSATAVTAARKRDQMLRVNMEASPSGAAIFSVWALPG